MSQSNPVRMAFERDKPKTKIKIFSRKDIVWNLDRALGFSKDKNPN
jgi:hypothetical protein